MLCVTTPVLMWCHLHQSLMMYSKAVNYDILLIIVKDTMPLLLYKHHSLS